MTTASIVVDIDSLHAPPAVPSPITSPVCQHCMRAMVPYLYIEHHEPIVLWRGHYLPITNGEHRVLKDLVTGAPRPRTIKQLYAALRQCEDFNASDVANNVRTCIKRIRKKFRAVDPRFDCIVALPAVGYKWLGL
jgi:DNA-binding response OmpR family regulator